jgi:predicted protein tyrosine phosphatase
MSTTSISANFLGIALRICLLAVIAAAPAYLFLANFAAVEPYLVPLHAIQAGVRQVSPYVIVGPYPDAKTLRLLHERGTNVVISLLDKDLIYENSLITRENALASTIGMQAFNAPMDSSQPRTSPLNAAALSRIRAFVSNHPQTQIYIHCYLGKHRAQQVAAMLEQQEGKPEITRR